MAQGGKRRITTPAAAVGLALLCIAIIVLGVLREIEARNADLRIAENAAGNLARSLMQHAEDTIQIVDTVLVGLVHRLETEGMSPPALGRLQGVLALRRTTLPRLRGLFVLGADGAWLAASQPPSPARRNYADRNYFVHHRTSPDKGIHIGAPIKSPLDGQWIVTVSRRVDNPDGSFAGVVLGTIDVAYFSEMFAAFDVGLQGSISLLSPQATLIARLPRDEEAIGRTSPLMQAAMASPSGFLRFRSGIDGVRRVSAFYRDPRIPLVALVARGEDEVLAEWRVAAAWRMALVLVLVGGVAILGIAVIRELSARQRLLQVIQTREADFRLLAEASNDMVSRISFDGTLTYVSPSALRIVGWPPGKLVGSPALAGLMQEDRAAVERIVEDMRQGRRTEALISYRTRHRTAGMVWLESAISVTSDAETGEIDGVVVVSRDVTEQKQAEGHLLRLATLDGLTGLANRRSFDEALREALAGRQERDEPLALLLMDVDHFKAFNDTYGHQVGDHCLKQVAGVLQSHATRPADLAARYGGEEFALILPQTDAAGCRMVAERIRAAVDQLTIPHAASTTAEHVTISVGGAVLEPGGTSLSAVELVDLADQALYAAKRAGRNKVRVSASVHSVLNHISSGKNGRRAG